jgi:L-asparaginase II
MLAATAASGGTTDDYLLPDSDVHRGARAFAERLAGTTARAVGTDGCGVPSFAFALREMAAAYARLPSASPRALEAMRSHPFLVAGTSRICTAAMTRTPGLVLKVGAEGLICGALIDRGLGFALKARDGGMRGREPATLHVLEALGAIGSSARDEVLEAVMSRLLPARGHKPELRVRGELKLA